MHPVFECVLFVRIWKESLVSSSVFKYNFGIVDGFVVESWVEDWWKFHDIDR